MNKRILIVDDNETNVAALQELLEDEYEVRAAYSGEEGLEAFREFGPDLILLDIMMPGIDGYETCKRIKSSPEGRLTQVILVSAKSSSEERLAGYAVDADDYVVKPFDQQEMLAKVRVQFRMRRTLLELASAQARLSVHNTKLEELIEQRTEETLETRDAAVFALAKLAESRDPETGEHLERLRGYSQILAEELAAEGPYQDQIDEAFLADLYRSSPLHDIGKVGIPDVILLKPGRLSLEEFEIMQRHTIIGAEALESTAAQSASGGFLEMAARIARYHHERFNGKGYPEGLGGEEIPLEARIVALADVYDALTSVRVYKSAFEPLVARSMIEEEEGHHFDPVVVDAFRRSWQRFLEERARVEAGSAGIDTGAAGDASTPRELAAAGASAK
jgi:response regulator RpfG family c-di-GMP phosphodiesterase